MKVELIEAIFVEVNEQEVEEVIPWKCYCGNNGFSLAFKGLQPPNKANCEKCTRSFNIKTT